MRTINKEDFKIFNINGRCFVYLVELQHVMEITNSSLKAYFDVANGALVDCELDEGLANSITTELAKPTSIANVSRNATSEQVMLTLNTTHECNMACKYCFATTISNKGKAMSVEVATKAIYNVVEMNPHANHYIIYFFGGEPLLHKDFIRKVCDIAKGIFANLKNKRLSFLLNTNGTLLEDANFLLFLKKERFGVTVSVDGEENVNDKNRTFPNGKGSFNKIMRGIDMLKRHGVNFDLRATFCPNVKDLRGTIQFFEELAVPYSYAFTVWASGKGDEETRFNDADVERIAKEWHETTKYLSERMFIGLPIYNMEINRKLSAIENGSRRTYGCEAGRGALIVDENGNYYTCQNMLPFKSTTIGNLQEGIDMVKRKKYRSQYLAEQKGCQKCWARYLCGGGCEVERFLHPNDYARRISPRCKITQMEWKDSIELYINKSINNLKLKER